MPELPRGNMTTGDTICALHAIVEGRVQGVGFRAYVQRTAATLGLTGWVRNKYDGRVEVWAEGSMQDNLRLLDALRKGPPASYVIHVETSWDKPYGGFSHFSVHSSE